MKVNGKSCVRVIRCNTFDNTNLSGNGQGINVAPGTFMHNLGTPTSPNGNAFVGYNQDSAVVYNGLGFEDFKYYSYDSPQERFFRVTGNQPPFILTPITTGSGNFNTGITADGSTCSGTPGVSYRIAARGTASGNEKELTRKDSVYAMMDSLKYQLGSYRRMKEWQSAIVSYFEDEKKPDALQKYAESIRDCNLEACTSFMFYLMEKHHAEGQCSKGHECKQYAKGINQGNKEVDAAARYFEYRCRKSCDTTYDHNAMFMMSDQDGNLMGRIDPRDSTDLIYLAQSGTNLAEVACFEMRMMYPYKSVCDWDKIMKEHQDIKRTLDFKMPELGTECKQKRNEFLRKGYEEATGFKAEKQGAQLSQNIPNPASNETVIPYLIPVEAGTEIKEAYIIIHNMMTGIEVIQIQLIDAGYSTVGISLDKFDSGIYTYTLIVNGVQQDIKKMVIVK